MIYVDEVVFSRTSNAKFDFSRAYQNIEVGMDQNRTAYRAVIAAISWEKGLKAIGIYRKAVDQHMFKSFI